LRYEGQGCGCQEGRIKGIFWYRQEDFWLNQDSEEEEHKEDPQKEDFCRKEGQELEKGSCQDPDGQGRHRQVC
jgi:hypothetical protein